MGMQFGSKAPPEVLAVIKPAYKGAERGGTPFVAGTEKEVTAIWRAMERVYGNRADALAAVKKTQQVILPFINSPEVIVGVYDVLVDMMGKDKAGAIIRKNPGVLACNPASLAQTSADEIEKAANFVEW